MKQKDIALILVIVFMSSIFSFFISNLLFGSAKARTEQVEVVQPISSSFPKPDTRYFNNSSLNPTKPVTIGNENNQNPFNGNTTGQ